MIASRKMDRLSAAAEDIKKHIPKNSPARLEYMQCNIREEEQVWEYEQAHGQTDRRG